jgi:nucleotide-binding universal stress UspA family protein
MTAKIVVGVDGSATAGKALAWATAEAARRHATLVIVYAWTVPPIAYSAPDLGAFIDHDGLAAAADDTLKAQLEAADLSMLSEPAQPMVVEGPAGQDILDAAEDAELIVVGARGHSELTQLIIGSVSQHVLHHARVPVVVIPHAAA